MNYIAEINAFEQWLETHYLPISSQLLWYKLMAICNRSGWSEWVTVDNLRLMAAMQMGREATLIKARDELIKAGLIEYQKGKKGSPNKYKIISFTCKNAVQSEVKRVVERVVQSEVEGVVESVDIYKHKQNKTKHIPPISPVEHFEEFTEAYPKKCTGNMVATEYCKAVVEGVPEMDLVNAAKNYAIHCQRDKTPGQFIKNPENFIRDNTFLKYVEGVEDEPRRDTEHHEKSLNEIMAERGIGGEFTGF